MRLRQHGPLIGIIVFVGFTIACSATSVRRPITRDGAAQAAILRFKSATIVPMEPSKQDGTSPQWNATLTIGAPPIKVQIIGSANISTLRARYSDGTEYPTSPVRDYTNNIEVRVQDATLFVYRVVTLMWTEHRLAVFDLAGRRQIADHLISPEDIPQPQRPAN